MQNCERFPKAQVKVDRLQLLLLLLIVVLPQFSDVLLHTFVASGGIYKFKNEMPIFGMQVRTQV